MSELEEQEQELEVLESIYPEELTKISPNEFTIDLALEVPHQDMHAEDYDPPIIILHVKYPPTYPNTAPELEITTKPQPSHPINLETDLSRLTSELETAVEDNMGMQMIFTLTSTLKDAAETIIRERVEAVEAAALAVRQAVEEKEMEKFRGEMVTREVFEKWSVEFKEEVRLRKEKEEKEREDAEAQKGGKKGGAVGVKKMTGREMFERGLAGGVEDDEDGEDIEEEVEKLKIDA